MWGIMKEKYMAFKNKEQKREYQREYQRGWYRRHKERILEMRKQRRIEIRDWFRRYKNTLHCIDCGENHPACLQFHHKNRAKKSFGLGYVAGSGSRGIKTLLKEINKCEVLCGNCHAKRHWREEHEFDTWEEILAPE